MSARRTIRLNRGDGAVYAALRGSLTAEKVHSDRGAGRLEARVNPVRDPRIATLHVAAA